MINKYGMTMMEGMKMMKDARDEPEYPEEEKTEENGAKKCSCTFNDRGSGSLD